MIDPGVFALADSGRFDPARLRAERRERVLGGMRDDRVDALLIGRPANVRYASGARPLWLAGGRAFAPTAVVLRDGETHLLTNSDDGVPPEVPLDNLFATSWNPTILMDRLAAIGGLASARTIGVDGLTPLFDGLLSATFPKSELVDATPLLHRARATKTDDELSCLRTASAVCEAALSVVVGNLVEGAAERDLAALFVERMASFGTTTPAFDGTFCVMAEGESPRRFTSDRTITRGDVVALDAGVLFNGYEGGLGRTWPAEDGEPSREQLAAARRASDSFDALLDACRPGATAESLAAVVPESAEPVAHGVGLGVEPLATEVGSTLCLQVQVDGMLRRDTVVLRVDGPEFLSRFPAGPLFSPH